MRLFGLAVLFIAAGFAVGVAYSGAVVFGHRARSAPASEVCAARLVDVQAAVLECRLNCIEHRREALLSEVSALTRGNPVRFVADSGGQGARRASGQRTGR